MLPHENVDAFVLVQHEGVVQDQLDMGIYWRHVACWLLGPDHTAESHCAEKTFVDQGFLSHPPTPQFSVFFIHPFSSLHMNMG